MVLEVKCLTLGPAVTNCYIIAESTSKKAVVIDPAWDGHLILAKAAEQGWNIESIWLTHAHFDHIGGSKAVVDGTDPSPPVALHPDDLWLFQAQGGAQFFGLEIDPGPEPSIELEDKQSLKLGDISFEVRLAPGHSPGHVMFYCEEEAILFCGDVIFNGSIGRTDLPGGNYNQLIQSINDRVLTLPDETRLLNGHGPETTVGRERVSNPFL